MLYTNLKCNCGCLTGHQIEDEGDCVFICDACGSEVTFPQDEWLFEAAARWFSAKRMARWSYTELTYDNPAHAHRRNAVRRRRINLLRALAAANTQRLAIGMAPITGIKYQGDSQ